MIASEPVSIRPRDHMFATLGIISLTQCMPSTILARMARRVNTGSRLTRRRAVVLTTVAVFCGLPLPMLAAQDTTTRGIGAASTADSGTLRNARYHALLIAVEKYTDPALPALSDPVHDAERLREVLTNRYRFERRNVTLLRDPKREDILRQLRRLSDELGSNDNLLVFYAGHGIWDKGSEQSFWLPVDARRIDDTNWISSADVARYMKRLRARHALIVADACYAGAALMRDVRDAVAAGMERLYAMPSRRAMTSGSKEEVPDRSVFLDVFIARLNENKEPFLPALNLFASLNQAVMANSKVTPQFGVIRDVGHEGGDFLFPLKTAGAVDENVTTASGDSGKSRGADTSVRVPTTPTEIIEAKNRDFVALLQKKDVETLGLYYADPSNRAEWKEQFLRFVRVDLTRASLHLEETRFERNEALSEVQVKVQYRDPAVAGTYNTTLHFLVRRVRVGDTWEWRSFYLTRKPPI